MDSTAADGAGGGCQDSNLTSGWLSNGSDAGSNPSGRGTATVGGSAPASPRPGVEGVDGDETTKEEVDGSTNNMRDDNDDEEYDDEYDMSFSGKLIIQSGSEPDEDVDSDEESQQRKVSSTLTRLDRREFDAFLTGPKVCCPFCPKRIASDFMSVMRHAETGYPQEREGQNMFAVKAKHRTYGIFLSRQRNLDIEEGRVPAPRPKRPKVVGQGSKKHGRNVKLGLI